MDYQRQSPATVDPSLPPTSGEDFVNDYKWDTICQLHLTHRLTVKLSGLMQLWSNTFVPM